MIDTTTEALRLAPLVLVAGTTLMATVVVVGNVTDPRQLRCGLVHLRA